MVVVAGKHIKFGMLPADVGCVVDNVATVRAIYRAVAKDRAVKGKGGFTVSGGPVVQQTMYILIVKIGNQL